MDSRTAAHVLNQIGSLLQLAGAPRFNSRAYKRAAQAVLALGADDLTPLLKSGELKRTPNVGPATLAVIQELIETGESSYLNKLNEGLPRGLLEMIRVPGLGLSKVTLIHQELGIESLEELEEAARDGRLARLPKFGPKTAERVLAGISFAKDSGRKNLYYRALLQAVVLQESVERHPDVVEAIIAGGVRRHNEIVGDVDIVAICKGDPVEVARSVANATAVKVAVEDGSRIAIRYIDDTRMNLWCTNPNGAGTTLWRATGSEQHIIELTSYAEEKGIDLDKAKQAPTEAALFRSLELAEIPPEMREGMGEIEAAAANDLPDLIVSEDIKGALHCHSTWSDGGATIEEMAQAAKDRGWKYIGITDHSQYAFYAGGMKRDKIERQHDEIDEINSRTKGFRILKGIECDILPDGSLDYGDDTLDMFDYVIGSVHSQFKMDRDAMTARVLKAMDDPHLTILGHATGRLLLSREGYSLDIDAVIEKAAATGTVLELNCDPHRMDLDWRHVRKAKEKGVLIEIGPDAHSEMSLDNIEMGVGLARKAWLSRSDVLNTKPAREVLSIAKSRRKR
jgi:DNA polymerase (family 10)